MMGMMRMMTTKGRKETKVRKISAKSVTARPDWMCLSVVVKKLSAVALTRIARLAITVKIKRRKMDFMSFGIGGGDEGEIGEVRFGFELVVVVVVLLLVWGWGWG
jgi:hypothetical protein